MDSMTTTLRLVTKRYPVACVLVLVLFLQVALAPFVLQIPAVFQQGPAVDGMAPAPVPCLSDIRGPQIDTRAAMTASREACLLLPSGTWIVLLLAYLAILIFNLGYGFRKEARIRWFWEFLYTLAFLGMWLFFDPCLLFPGFPILLIASGLTVFAAYVYLFEKQRSYQELFF